MSKIKKKSNNILTKGDLEVLGDLMGGLIDKQAAVLASKQDLKNELNAAENRIKTELKEYMHEGFETVMQGMDDVVKQLAEKEKVERLVEWAKEVGAKVGVKVKI